MAAADDTSVHLHAQSQNGNLRYFVISRGDPQDVPRYPNAYPTKNYEANTRKLRKRTENRPQMFGIDRPAKQWVVAINVFDQPFSDWTIIF